MGSYWSISIGFLVEVMKSIWKIVVMAAQYCECKMALNYTLKNG